MELGKFEILEELGRGGFGIVYKAHDKTLNRLVAIKELYPELLTDPSFLSRFKQEAQIAANLDNPNVVPVYEFGESKGRYYIVMGYMPGGSLKDLIKKEGSLSKERALEILQQFGAGLTYIHKKGVIHRDLKPGNILFDDSGKARISDMGFAKLLRGNSGKSISGSGGLVGTPAYMAPEIWKEKPATAAVDIYSLACILVEMLIAEPLFQADSTPGVMLRHFEALKLPESLPKEWKTVIKRALEKSPENRFGTVEEFLSALQTACKKTIRGTGKNEETKTGLIEKPTQEPKEHKTRKHALGLWAWLNERIDLSTSAAIYTGLGLVAALLAVFIIIRFGVVSIKPEPTTEPQAKRIQDTATSQPDPTQTKQTVSTVRPKDGMEMVYVPEGSFEMGSTTGYDDEKPVRQVYLDAYWIDKFEVTNAQYEHCVAAGVCTKPYWTGSQSQTQNSYYGSRTYANHPVIYVSWNQAREYCQWAGGDLPTEAQWEKAARGTDGREYPWGDTAPNFSLANYNMYNGDTTEVGSYPHDASPYGAMDMAGNVWEWVRDWYMTYNLIETNNPSGPANGDSKVLRGSNWYNSTRFLRTTYRSDESASHKDKYTGFRCVSLP